MTALFPDRGLPINNLDYQFMLNYNQELGFKFAIDSLFNADPNFLYVALASIYPPGGIHATPP